MPAAALKEEMVSKALMKRLEKTAPEDMAFVEQELDGAPLKYKKSLSSIVKEDVFRNVDLQFPVLLRRSNEHRMQLSDFFGEIELLMGMGHIRDADSSVFIYSLQVMEPLDITNQIDMKAIEAFAPTQTLLELKNGYLRHELLYDVPDHHAKILLISLLRCAKRVRVSLKPPWSTHKVESDVVLVQLGQ